MVSSGLESLDVKIHDALTAWKKIDITDVKILEGLSLLGPRNLARIAKYLDMPTTTVRYRVQRMLADSILFFHINPYHTNLGLKKAVIFVEAEPGYEDILLNCLSVNDFWLYLCRIYGPYEGCAGIWTVPKGKDADFIGFLKNLHEVGVSRSFEINWTTCHEGIPVRRRWFDSDDNVWTFDWKEWMEEVKTIEGKLPWTLIEPDDWPINADHEDLLIIKELEKDGKKTLTDISKILDIPFEKVKYHFREHVSKRGLIEGYQVDLLRYPYLVNEPMFFRFDFDSEEKMRRFALSLHDKPFPTFLGKVLDQNALISHINLPNWEFRRFIASLSTLIQKGLLKKYKYTFVDIYQARRETIPYQNFRDDKWIYDSNKHIEALGKVLGNLNVP